MKLSRKSGGNTVNRRTLVHGSLGALGVTMFPSLAAAFPTPKATEGPFYPEEEMRFADIDNDLVKIEGEVTEAGGEIVHLNGRVFWTSGEPVEGARVEIWQCDVNGRYLHTNDTGNSERDRAFQGFGHDVTDTDGNYEFRTILPVAYVGRTPHIHVKVLAGRRELTTQFYIANDPRNNEDWLYNRMSVEERNAVEMDFKSESGNQVASVNIILKKPWF